MDTISRPDLKKRPLLASSQLRYAAAYVLITFVVLLFLNLYTASTIRSLTFSAQKTAMEDKLQLIVSSFSTVETLDEPTVREVVTSTSDLHATRVIVTDPAGYVLYDSNQGAGRLVLFPEITEALAGNDVFYAHYDERALVSRAAMPIMSFNRLIGAVYLMERDADQAALIGSLQRNILRISLVLVAAVLLFSLVFSLLFSRRMRRIVGSVQQMYAGNYDQRLQLRGNDEVAQLGAVFNELAARLGQSEAVRKQFVSNASHELKTPLASIRLLSDSILQNDMDPATTREFVHDIGEEADRLTRLTEKLLELTKLDSVRPDEREIDDVGQVAGRVLRMLEPLAKQRDVTLALQAAPDCTVLSAEDDLYQILFNLAENAIKYNRPGGSVLLKVRREDETVVIDVEDTGLGIPEEARSHIFERFYRVDKARSRKAGGAGLGLSIVHDVTQRNDGTVEVDEREGGGSRFTLRFPAFDLEEGGEDE